MNATIKTEDAEKLMKRCQIGVGGPYALNKAHDIMAECYGTIGSLVQERDELLRELESLNCVDDDLSALD